MSTLLEVHFRLSIWRPASLDRNYLHCPHDNDSNTFSPLKQSDVLEQIYSWNAGPHDVLSSAPDQFSSDIQNKLIDKFSLEYRPDRRSLPEFHDVVEELLGNSNLYSKDFWVDLQESVAIDGEEELNVRANITLAFLLHLHWVARTFYQVPRASVLIR